MIRDNHQWEILQARMSLRDQGLKEPSPNKPTPLSLYGHIVWQFTIVSSCLRDWLGGGFGELLEKTAQKSNLQHFWLPNVGGPFESSCTVWLHITVEVQMFALQIVMETDPISTTTDSLPHCPSLSLATLSQARLDE